MKLKIKQKWFTIFQVESVLKSSRTFFRLPDDNKSCYQRTSNRIEGYSGIDQEM